MRLKLYEYLVGRQIWSASDDATVHVYREEVLQTHLFNQLNYASTDCFPLFACESPLRVVNTNQYSSSSFLIKCLYGLDSVGIAVKTPILFLQICANGVLTSINYFRVLTKLSSS